MKPILRLDEDAVRRLRNLMDLRGLECLEDAAEYAFVESERKALMEKLYANPLPDEAWGEMFDPSYSLEDLRVMDISLPPPDNHDAPAP